MAHFHLNTALVAAAAMFFGAALSATAQSSGSGGFNLDAPPGYATPDEEVIIIERELLRPFNDSPVTYDDRFDSPLNEFAGQRERVNRGIIGDVLHSAKSTILNQ